MWARLLPVVDALALGCWAATGAQKTLAYGLGWLPAVLLGTITAVGGGFVRDVVLRRIPAVLGGNTLYATCALAASGVMVVLFRAGHPTAGPVAATAWGPGCACSPAGATGRCRTAASRRRCAPRADGARHLTP